MAWTSPTTRATDYLVTAANWNELVNNFLHLDEVGRASKTSDVAITATTVGTAQEIATLGAITYEAVPHKLEFYCPRLSVGAQTTFLVLRDVTTVVGTLGRWNANDAFGGLSIPYIFTPTAASHTYNVAGWNNGASTSTWNFGTGGTAGDDSTDLQGFLQVSRIPT